MADDWLDYDQQLKAKAHQPQYKRIADKRADPTRQPIGRGLSGYVDRSTDQHQLDNVERVAREADGTNLFYKWLLDNPQAMKNPFMPRIRATSSKSGVSEVQMEALIPFYSKVGNAKTIEMWWERLFSDPAPNTTDDAEMQNAFEARMQDAKREGNTKDETFMAALNILYAAAERNGTGIDMHGDNLMWRMSGTMPQLVIIDPFVD